MWGSIIFQNAGQSLTILSVVCFTKKLVSPTGGKMTRKFTTVLALSSYNCELMKSVVAGTSSDPGGIQFRQDSVVILFMEQTIRQVAILDRKCCLTSIQNKPEPGFSAPV